MILWKTHSQSHILKDEEDEETKPTGTHSKEKTKPTELVEVDDDNGVRHNFFILERGV